MRDPNTSMPTWRREAEALLRQGQLIATGLWTRPRPAASGRTAVFVHGFMAAGPVFDPLREHVERVTGLPSLRFTYSSLASFSTAANRLRSFLDEQVPAGARISLVGHSLGGLLARWYIQEMGGHERVDRLVTLATPHAGTERVRMVPLPLTRALHPEGGVIRQLEQRAHLLTRIPHTAVVAGADHLVQPVHSAAAVQDARVVWLDGVSHNEVLYDARTQRLVVEALG